MEPEFKGRVVVEASVSPSEDVEKVGEAVRNVLGGSERDLERERLAVRFVSEDIKSLKQLRDQLRDRHVRSAARRLLLSEKKGNSTTLMLNRQAATVGVLVVCSSPEESPLGPIYVTLQSKRINSIIDWLTAYESG